jgi:hypothetical protein
VMASPANSVHISVVDGMHAICSLQYDKIHRTMSITVYWWYATLHDHDAIVRQILRHYPHVAHFLWISPGSRGINFSMREAAGSRLSRKKWWDPAGSRPKKRDPGKIILTTYNLLQQYYQHFKTFLLKIFWVSWFFCFSAFNFMCHGFDSDCKLIFPSFEVHYHW